MSKTANYKGRTYQLKFIGKTKFGDKAKLAFMDGSKEFWVDSNLVTVDDGGKSGYTPKAGRRKMSEDDRCEVCDGNKWTCGHCVGW